MRLRRREFLKSSVAGLASALAPMPLLAQDTTRTTLIRGAKVFDGSTPDLLTGLDVLIDNGMIKAIGESLTADGADIIDADGRVMTPGMTDAHVHIMWNDTIDELIFGSPHEYTGAMAGESARRMLQRGFTTVRDTGGPAFGLKKAIDQGVVPGPRILPSGFFISQTSGHGDFDSRLNYLSPHFSPQIDPAYLRGWTIIADGVPEVQKATREILRYGATQIKIMGSGSITGAHDPLDVTEYTFDELSAIVQEARHWGTYATIHAYTDTAIQNAIRAGVRSLEHGLFASEETMQMMKDADIFYSTQFLSFTVGPEQAGMTGDAIPKYLEAQAGATNGYERSKALGLKMAFGTDILGTIDLGPFQSMEFEARTKYYEPVEILTQATSLNAELFERSGRRHPYQAGPLGVIAEGAYADLLLVNGNPLEDITLMSNPESGLGLIMKGGETFKNTL